ncbi:hypothetical protein C6A37_10720, partial [Desulfobacteraceae bacterium SEEP-SAG9]
YVKNKGLRIIYPSKKSQCCKVHPAIYDPIFGVKAKSNPVTVAARRIFHEVIDELIEQGAECIVLACTEIPIAINAKEIKGRPVVDPTLILARALINNIAPEKLKPFEQ